MKIMNETDENIIGHTKLWIRKVVIDCNFCPFAAKELKRDAIHYRVIRTEDPATLLASLSEEFDRLEKVRDIETTLIIMPGVFPGFPDYLEIVSLMEKFLKVQGKEGVFQIATFHPDYMFEGSDFDDPANYTNRSIYPMFQILRESSITQALAHFPEPEKIPAKNIEFARRKGLAFMKILRESCMRTLF